MRATATLAAALLSAATAILPAAAQPDAQARALIEQLSPPCPPNEECRGLRVPREEAALSKPEPARFGPSKVAAGTDPGAGTAQPSKLATRPPSRPTVPTVPAVSLSVVFQTGLAVVTPDAERVLDPLGRALTSPELAGYRFRIEGHTDLVGDPAANQLLSERRAAAVRLYLQERFGVAAERLEVVGLGASYPVVPTAPQVPEPRNRRVVVVNIGT